MAILRDIARIPRPNIGFAPATSRVAAALTARLFDSLSRFGCDAVMGACDPPTRRHAQVSRPVLTRGAHACPYPTHLTFSRSWGAHACPYPTHLTFSRSSAAQ